jgi:hypothetical protein
VLTDDGRQTGSLVAGGTFWAHRDGVLLRFSGGSGVIAVSAYPAEPVGVRDAAITGSSSA